ncbi:MAG: hypothetical protein FWC89_02805 [Defluviitaleaceae bacterium]|nr:hypothetical protein [Defluviitaleaceae bacterium]
METEQTNNKDDFYAVVSAIARFIETADDDIAPQSKKNPTLQTSQIDETA